MKSVVWSAQGQHSEQNEDACFARPSRGLFAVADGVGGGPAGEVASRKVIDTLTEQLDVNDLQIEIIFRSIDESNRRVNIAAEKPGNAGMACTLAVAWISENTLHCFHVGDSRIYRHRESVLTQLTQDHSTLVVKPDSRLKSVITRAIGVKADVNAEHGEWDWQTSDVLLIMSDGISDKLSNEDIQFIMNDKSLSMSDRARRLTRESEIRGGTDDKTVVLAF